MDNDTKQQLRDFLLAREYDIAVGIEDFGALQGIFEQEIGRKPSEKLAPYFK